MQRYCKTCLKVKVACFCHLITQIENKTKVLILQHPSETKHPLGTGKMASLNFKNSELFIGEDFSNDKILDKLIKSSQAALLWPNSPHYYFESINHKIFKPNLLIAIDATWKKAFKMYMLSKNLQKIPKISFQKKRNSLYYLRKEPKENFLSTIEALSYGLKERE